MGYVQKGLELDGYTGVIPLSMEIEMRQRPYSEGEYPEFQYLEVIVNDDKQ